ncbi:hypothetical protein [Oligella urethralis]|uniref:hypothetical protein n=1 Tax=Oligella urethralis TaxID=90245 RepID=UPI000DD65773|nr:hypothetical protein [Oligella urethralis]
MNNRLKRVRKVRLRSQFQTFDDLVGASGLGYQEVLDLLTAWQDNHLITLDLRFTGGWTKDEDEYLVINYPDPYKDIEDMAMELGRTIGDIYDRVKRLDIKRGYKFDDRKEKVKAQPKQKPVKLPKPKQKTIQRFNPKDNPWAYINLKP